MDNLHLGVIQQLRGQNFAIFDTPPLPSLRGQKDIFDPFPPLSSCPKRSY